MRLIVPRSAGRPSIIMGHHAPGRRIMLKRLLLGFTALAVVAAAALAPSPSLAQDARTALDGAAKAMGATSLTSIRYVARGDQFAVGQSFVPGAPWPRFNLTSLVRTVDYASGAGREEMVRTQGTVNLAESVQRLGFNVDRILPLHSRMVSYAEMLKWIGKGS
jgi:hypothetical protein